MENTYGRSATFTFSVFYAPFSDILTLIITVVSIIAAIIVIVFLLRMKGIIGKAHNLRIFISHKVSDKDSFKIAHIIKDLDAMKQVDKIFTCEEDLAASKDIDKFMRQKIAMSHILIFMASPGSLDSRDCAYELSLAKKHGLHLLPILAPGMDWSELGVLDSAGERWEGIDLSNLGLNRTKGLEFGTDYKAFIGNLKATIVRFKGRLDLIASRIASLNIEKLEVLENELNMSREELADDIKILVKMGKIKGVWVDQQAKFVPEKDVLAKIEPLIKTRGIRDVKTVVDEAGFDEEWKDYVRQLAKKHFKIEMREEPAA